MTTQLWIRGRETFVAFVGQLAIDNNLEEGMGSSVLLFLHQTRPSSTGEFHQNGAARMPLRGA